MPMSPYTRWAAGRGLLSEPKWTKPMRLLKTRCRLSSWLAFAGLVVYFATGMIIRTEQWEELSNQFYSEYMRELLPYLRHTYPEKCWRLSDEQLSQAVEPAILEAKSYDLLTRRA